MKTFRSCSRKDKDLRDNSVVAMLPPWFVSPDMQGFADWVARNGKVKYENPAGNDLFTIEEGIKGDAEKR